MNPTFPPGWRTQHTPTISWMVFPFDEAMIGPENIFVDLHHKSFFFSKLRKIDNSKFLVILPEGVGIPINPLLKEGIFAQGNMENIHHDSD